MFEKVSLNQFTLDMKANGFFDEEKIKSIYESIELPKRATIGSAGYDFFIPYDCNLNVLESHKVVTGIRVKMEEGYVLQIYPRSSLGFKYHLQLANTVGIIDSDYYKSDNEGHILIKIINEGFDEKPIHLAKGDAFSQGLFTKFAITYDDDAKDTRNGGFGSTDSKR